MQLSVNIWGQDLVAIRECLRACGGVAATCSGDR